MGQALDTLSLTRTFAKPGYTPAKHQRIFKDRWYLATMQNVERDPRCDYIGLAEGEYTELVNGAEARSRRDSQLNHLNRLEEYRGPVWEYIGYPYGHARQPLYFRSHAETEGEYGKLQNELIEWLEALRRESRKEYLSAETRADCLAILAKPHAWNCEIKQIR